MKLGARLGCHQRADRSLYFRGYQFPVCARCTGVLFGELIGIAIQLINPPDIWINFIFCIPMAFDWGRQRLGIKNSTQASRLLTGCLGGIGLISLHIYIIKGFFLLLY